MTEPDVAGGDPLDQYLETNWQAFTEVALVEGARAAGYSNAAIASAISRQHARDVGRPVRLRARRAVIAAYLATYALLSVGMVVNSSGYAAIGIAVLTVVLGLSYGIAAIWMGGNTKFAVVLLVGLLVFGGGLVSFAIGIVFAIVFAIVLVAINRRRPRLLDSAPAGAQLRSASCSHFRCCSWSPWPGSASRPAFPFDP